MDASLEKPIVIIGAARSGATMLASLLSRHPDLCYIDEPNVTWRYKNTKYWIDEFPASFASKEISRYINRVFSQYVKRNGGRRLLEKTPANSLRLPFVREVLPNSKIIHVIRDGRDVAFSVLRKWLLQEDFLKERLNAEYEQKDLPMQLKKFLAIPPHDMLWYSRDIFGALAEKVGVPRTYWGPRFAGMRDCCKFMSKLEVCAMQWQRCVEHVNNSKHLIDSDDFFEITYERLRMQPLKVLREVFAFCEIEEPQNIEEWAKSISYPMNVEWKIGLNQGDMSMLEKMLWPQLSRYGYV